MNVKTLLQNAIFKSLQDRQFQPNINDQYEQVALNFLNLILDEWRDYIPFAEEITFNNVDNLLNTTFVSISALNFILNRVSFTVESVTLTRFKELQEIIDQPGWPSIYYFDELKQSILIYQTPTMPNYQFTVWGRVQQINLGLFDDIPTNMPAFMENALTYELAFRLCAEYGNEASWNPLKEQIRQTSTANLISKKDIDLRTPRDIVFGSPRGIVPPFPNFFYLSGGGS